MSYLSADTGGHVAILATGECNIAPARPLQEAVARREPARTPDLFGTVHMDPAYDCKTERSRG